jgi:hypothetical protein
MSLSLFGMFHSLLSAVSGSRGISSIFLVSR